MTSPTISENIRWWCSTIGGLFVSRFLFSEAMLWCTKKVSSPTSLLQLSYSISSSHSRTQIEMFCIALRKSLFSSIQVVLFMYMCILYFYILHFCMLPRQQNKIKKTQNKTRDKLYSFCLFFHIFCSCFKFKIAMNIIHKRCWLMWAPTKYRPHHFFLNLLKLL